MALAQREHENFTIQETTLFVLYAADRIAETLVVVVLKRNADAVVQVQVIRGEATELSGTPEIRIVASVIEAANGVPIAGRQRRKTVDIRTVAVAFPAAQRLETPDRSCITA